jgi:hypothetical protein
MNMRSSAAYLALFIGLSVTLAGCGYMNQVRAMKAFKDGNKAYAASDWRVAANKYEEAAKLTEGDAACEWCPAIYFYLGNSYDNMYRPARKGEKANDELMEKAVANYKLASEKLTEETSPKRSLALDFLVAAYGPDKLADPTQAEPVVQRMIQLAPNEPAMPRMDVMMRPNLSSPGLSARAIKPTTNPTMMVPIRENMVCTWEVKTAVNVPELRGGAEFAPAAAP